MRGPKGYARDRKMGPVIAAKHAAKHASFFPDSESPPPSPPLKIVKQLEMMERKMLRMENRKYRKFRQKMCKLKQRARLPSPLARRPSPLAIPLVPLQPSFPTPPLTTIKPCDWEDVPMDQESVTPIAKRWWTLWWWS